MSNIPEPIRQELLATISEKQVSANDLVNGWLVKRYKVDLRFGGGPPRGADCDPLILKMPEALWWEIKQHAARVGCSMRALIIDCIARELDLTEHAIPLVRERSYAA